MLHLRDMFNLIRITVNLYTCVDFKPAIKFSYNHKYLILGFLCMIYFFIEDVSFSVVKHSQKFISLTLEATYKPDSCSVCTYRAMLANCSRLK